MLTWKCSSFSDVFLSSRFCFNQWLPFCPIVWGESVAASPLLFSEHNLFLTQNNNPTLFSLSVLVFYYFQVLRPCLPCKQMCYKKCPLFVVLCQTEYSVGYILWQQTTKKTKIKTRWMSYCIKEKQWKMWEIEKKMENGIQTKPVCCMHWK